MAEDPLALLERELVGAARRQAARAARPRLRLPAISGTVISVVAGAAAVVAVVGAGILAGRAGPSAPVAAARSTEQRLISSLGVLRQPSRGPAIDAATRRQIRAQLPGLVAIGTRGHVVSALMRRIQQAPGAVLVATTVSPAVGGPDVAVAVVARNQGAAEPASSLPSRGLLALVSYERRGMILVDVVPDGVMKVALVRGPTTFAVAAVRSNVALMHVRGVRLTDIVARSTQLWYGPANGEIRTIPPAIGHR